MSVLITLLGVNKAHTSHKIEILTSKGQITRHPILLLRLPQAPKTHRLIPHFLGDGGIASTKS